MSRYIDFGLIEKIPNKHKLTPKRIKKLKVLDWERLKKETWFNKTMKKPCWCKLVGCNLPGQRYNDEDEFWIGFYEDGKVDAHFSCYGGMCSYDFEKFYDAKDIEHNFDMQVQANTLEFLNRLIDEGVIGL